MALAASHLRYAIEMKDFYRVADLKRYLAGSIYPDSRYVTHIDRQLTHPPDFLSWHWQSADDFKKGWHVHLLTDALHAKHVKMLLPDLYQGILKQGSEVWVRISAYKNLADFDDLKKFKIKSCLEYLDYAECPNGEELVTIKNYNQLFTEYYADPEKIALNDYGAIWSALGVDNELVQQVMKKTEIYSHNKRMLGTLEKVHQLVKKDLEIIK